MASSDYILGIDVGKSGGYAVQFAGRFAYAIPQRDSDWVQEVRQMRYTAAEENIVPIAYVEKVPSYVGRNIPSSRSFVLGYHFGLTMGALIANHFDVRLVRPQTWQKSLGLKREKGTPQPEWKRQLRDEAQRRNPNIKVTLKTADALLILAYGLQDKANETDS